MMTYLTVQKLFGHPVQDSLPAHHRSFVQAWQKSSEEADRKAKDTQENAEQIYNQHVHELPNLNMGNHVAIQIRTVGHLRDSHSNGIPQALPC